MGVQPDFHHLILFPQTHGKVEENHLTQPRTWLRDTELCLWAGGWYWKIIWIIPLRRLKFGNWEKKGGWGKKDELRDAWKQSPLEGWDRQRRSASLNLEEMDSLRIIKSCSQERKVQRDRQRFSGEDGRPARSWERPHFQRGFSSCYLSKLTCAAGPNTMTPPQGAHWESSHKGKVNISTLDLWHPRPPTHQPKSGPQVLSQYMFTLAISNMYIQQVSLFSSFPSLGLFFLIHSLWKFLDSHSPGTPALCVPAQCFPNAKSENRSWDLPHHNLYHGEFVFSATWSWKEVPRAGVLIDWGLGVWQWPRLEGQINRRLSHEIVQPQKVAEV